MIRLTADSNHNWRHMVTHVPPFRCAVGFVEPGSRVKVTAASVIGKFFDIATAVQVSARPGSPHIDSVRTQFP